MTPEELKSMMEQQAAEIKSAQDAAKSANDLLAEKEQELKSAKEQIANLDATAKEQQKAIDNLTIEVKANKIVDFKSALRAEMEANKPAMEKFIAEKKGEFGITLEVKTITNITTGSISPNNILGVAVDPTIHAAVGAPNVFVAVFGLRPRTANKMAWIEATSESGAAYVGELAQNTAKSDVKFAEKTRLFGKLATMMRISTEVEDWFEQIYNYCVNEGVRLLENKLDAEIYGGNGDDSSNPTHIYGVKGQATAFSALAAGAVTSANVADVILDSAAQIAKEGYNANVAFVTWAIYRELKELKSSAGEYIFTDGLLEGIRVYPTARLASGEILVADTNCVEVQAGNSYELEFVRDGEYDAYNVYFRKAAQVKVPTPKKKGLIYVASATTAVAALQVATA